MQAESHFNSVTTKMIDYKPFKVQGAVNATRRKNVTTRALCDR